MEDNNTFRRVLGRADVIALGFGTMVGWAWVMLSGTWLSEAGFLGSLIAFAISLIFTVIIGLIYSELTSAMPLAGGEVVYTYKAFGDKMAWFVGWTMTFAYIGVASWEGIALATAIDYLLPIPQKIYLWDVAGYSVYFSWTVVGIVGAVVMLILNLFGTRPAIIFQVMSCGVIIIVGLIFMFGGVTSGSTENTGNMFEDVDGIVFILLMLPSMLIGFDVIPQSVEEMNIPLKSISKTIIVSICMAVLFYIVILISMALSAPSEVRDNGLVPAADTMTYLFGDDTMGKVLIFGGIMGILTCWNGFFVGATRLMFAMGRAKMLPAIFGRLHHKYRTPWAAILLIGLLCIITPFFGRNALVWFVNNSSFCVLIVYFFMACSFLLLRVKSPEIPRPFRIPLGNLFAILVMVMIVIFLGVYLMTNLNEEYMLQWYIVGAWYGAGIVLFIWCKIKYSNISKEQRELLIFGERYLK